MDQNDVAGKEQRAKEHICQALDLNDEGEILRCVDELKDLVGYFKLNSAFTLFGPELVRRLLDRGCKIFLDLKLHDIPNTVAGYADAVTRLGVHIVTLHTAGGLEMMKEAMRVATETSHLLGIPRPKLIGVTLLTSIQQKVLNQEMNIPGSVEEEVLRKTKLAIAAGLDGIVCSPAELASVRQALPGKFFCVTPGVRTTGADPHDHKRVHSVSGAIAAGSDLLVVGRTIVRAVNRRAAAREILEEVMKGLQN